MGNTHATRSIIGEQLRTGLISSDWLKGETGEILFDVAEGMDDLDPVAVTEHTFMGFPQIPLKDGGRIFVIHFIHENFFVEDLQDPEKRAKIFEVAVRSEREIE